MMAYRTLMSSFFILEEKKPKYDAEEDYRVR